MIYLFVVRTFLDGVRNLLDGVCNFPDGVCNFLDGVRNFLDGVRNFLDGVRNFLDGVRTFLDGVRNFLYGARTFLDGARTFLDGARNFLDGHMTYALIRWKCLIAAKLCVFKLNPPIRTKTTGVTISRIGGEGFRIRLRPPKWFGASRCRLVAMRSRPLPAIINRAYAAGCQILGKNRQTFNEPCHSDQGGRNPSCRMASIPNRQGGWHPCNLDSGNPCRNDAFLSK